ncbi:MAG: hypothetical protein ACK5B9_12340 [Flavobacteriia bacterium]|jgi:hypothetical protein
MKKSILLYSLLSVILISCFGHVPKGKEKKDLFGKWEGKTFVNPYFDLNITLDDNWQKNDKNFKTIFGATYIHADYYSPEDTSVVLATLNLESKKINPFDKGATVQKELQEGIDALKVLYNENEMLTEDFQTIQMGKRKYIFSRVILLEGEGDSTYVDEYMSAEKDYFLSLSLSYNSAKNRPICDEVLKQFKK